MGRRSRSEVLVSVVPIVTKTEAPFFEPSVWRRTIRESGTREKSDTCKERINQGHVPQERGQLPDAPGTVRQISSGRPA